jgi:hypothetical protein
MGARQFDEPYRFVTGRAASSSAACPSKAAAKPCTDYPDHEVESPC